MTCVFFHLNVVEFSVKFKEIEEKKLNHWLESNNNIRNQLLKNTIFGALFSNTKFVCYSKHHNQTTAIETRVWFCLHHASAEVNELMVHWCTLWAAAYTHIEIMFHCRFECMKCLAHSHGPLARTITSVYRLTHFIYTYIHYTIYIYSADRLPASQCISICSSSMQHINHTK